MTSQVFITGVAGFLGSHLADEFLERGYAVAGNDSFVGGYESNIPRDVEFHEVDCTDVEDMKGAMQGADIVYHTAALAYEGLSVFAPARVNSSIFDATNATLAAAADTGVDRFVYCSSMSRYGENETPFTEDMDPRPQDPYAVAKVASEDMVELMADIHGFEYTIAVPHNIIGPRQKYDDPFRNVAAIFINRMLRGKQPIIYGDGEQMRCFTFIQDDIRPLRKMATSEAAVGEVINIGPDDEFITINTLAETIADIIDFDLDPIYKPDRPQEVKLANCSADKARRLLNYEPEYTLRDGLEEMIEWVEAQGAKEFEYHLDLEIVTEDTPNTWADQLL
jgi:UDP-glucose 4-epimerase